MGPIIPLSQPSVGDDFRVIPSYFQPYDTLTRSVGNDLRCSRNKMDCIDLGTIFLRIQFSMHSLTLCEISWLSPPHGYNLAAQLKLSQPKIHYNMNDKYQSPPKLIGFEIQTQFAIISFFSHGNTCKLHLSSFFYFTHCSWFFFIWVFVKLDFSTI